MVKTPRGVFGKLSGLKPWLQIVILLAIIIVACSIGSEMAAKDEPGTGNPIPNQSASAQAGTETEGEAPVPARQPLTVTGSGESVVELGATLSGAYKMDYAFGSWCGAITFISASGEAAQDDYMAMNGCGSDTDTPLTGSAMVNLNGALMIQTENTRGNWTVTLTPVG